MGALVEKSRFEFLTSQVGRVESVLFERMRHGYLEGYTKNYTPVHVISNDNSLCGTIADVKLVSAEKDYCTGELVQQIP